MAVNINVPSQVKTYANLAAFPATGALKTIYIAEDTNKTYRWTGSVYVEVSASASGITIGSTAIASGVVGRVLFEGVGNVVQESSSLFWDNTNGTLTVNPLVNNAFYHKVGLNIFSDATTRMYFTSSATGANWNAGMTISSGTSTARWTIAGYGSTYDFTFYNETTASAALFIKGSTNNVLINTTTDAGFKLDVNGTARVNSNSFFATSAGSADGGNGVGIGTTTLGALDPNQRIVLLSSGLFPSYRLSAGGGSTRGFIGLNGNNNALNIGTDTGTYFAFFSANAERMRIFTTGNIGINTTTDAGFRLDVNGTARVQGAITGTSTLSVVGDIYLNHPSGGGSTSFITDANACYIVQNSSRNVQIGYVSNYTFRLNNSTRTIGVADNGASPTLDASAVLTLGSTTRGFLPPRMTTTQKNAIASPAAGLMVYDTTLNVISYYNGSMWI